MTDRGQLRAADTDRQATVDRLQTALAEGRLDLDEYDRRLQQAYSAVSYADLDRLAADLPDNRARPPRPERPAACVIVSCVATLPTCWLVMLVVLLVAVLT